MWIKRNSNVITNECTYALLLASGLFVSTSYFLKPLSFNFNLPNILKFLIFCIEYIYFLIEPEVIVIIL